MRILAIALAVYLVVINIVTFIVYGVDKSKSKKNKWRISEKTLILFAVVGGSIGAILGMNIFNHKTKHLKFTVGVPVIFLLQLVIVNAFLSFLLKIK